MLRFAFLAHVVSDCSVVNCGFWRRDFSRRKVETQRVTGGGGVDSTTQLLQHKRIRLKILANFAEDLQECSTASAILDRPDLLSTHFSCRRKSSATGLPHAPYAAESFDTYLWGKHINTIALLWGNGHSVRGSRNNRSLLRKQLYTFGPEFPPFHCTSLTSKMTSPTSLLYPSPSPAALKLQFVGKRLQEVQAPAAVLDVAVIRRNCKLMLDTVAKLNVGFRAHVKTHKVCQSIILG